MDKSIFFSYVRRAPFGNRLTQQQVEGMNAIISAWENYGNPYIKPVAQAQRFLAYILATSFHETGGRMIPVREGFGKNDAQSRKVVAGKKYGLPDPVTGHVYYGRGHVQLTWAENYKKMGKLLKLKLYENPDLALDQDISARILVEGMIKGCSDCGDFTGFSLEQFFNDTTEDPVGARKIINKLDRASLVASYYQSFLSAIQAADVITRPHPVEVDPKEAEPDKPDLASDKTVIGTVASAVGAGGLGFFSNIDNAWAFAAFAFLVILGLGVYLFVTGRISIARKAGM